MSNHQAAIIGRLRPLLITLAAGLGNDARGVSDDELIPDADVLDSAGLIEFVMQIDNIYRLDLQAEDMTIDNFGSLAATAAFIAGRQGKK
jgi:acyl carrier protein